MTNALYPAPDGLVPLALIIALSPLSVIPGILMLLTPKPRITGLAFLAGWAAGIAGLTYAFLAAYGAAGGFNGPAAWTAYARVAIGTALLASGVYRWLTRARSAHTPAWMRSLTGIGPGRAAAAAAALAVINPKVFLTCAAAGVTIAAAGMGSAASRAGVAAFTAVAASSVALPVLAYAAAGKKLDGPLTSLKSWLEARHAALTAAVLIAIGLVVISRGIHGLI